MNKKINLKILIPICILALISVFTIYSASTYTSKSLGNLALKQVIWYLVGSVLVIFIIRMRNEYLYRHTKILYILGNILLLGLLFFSEPINNSRCWYTIPGIGKEFVSAITNHDYTVVMGITIFIGAIIIVCNLLSDLICAIVDPRVRKSL